MTRFDTWLDAHPNARSALRSFVWAFIGVFVPSLLGFLGDIQEWANGVDQAFPAVSALAKAAVAAAAGAVASVCSFVWNKFGFTKTAVYAEPELPPPPPPEFA